VILNDCIKRYSGISEIQFEMASRKAVSCFVFGKRIFLILVDDTVIEVIIGTHAKSVMELHYFVITISSSQKTMSEFEIINDYGLLLPLKVFGEGVGINDDDFCYALITKSWKQLTVQGELNYSRVKGVDYGPNII